MGVFRNSFVLLFAMLTTLFGCTKNDESALDYPRNGAEVFSSVAVFNAVPNSTTINMYMGQGSVEKAIVTNSDKLTFGGYVPYKNWYTGSFDLTVENQTGSTKEILRKNIFIPSGKFFSLFVYRKGEMQTVLSEDNVIRPASGNAKIRIAHFSDNITDVSLYTADSKTALIKNIKYLAVSDYLELNIDKPYDFYVETIDGKIKLMMIGGEKLVDRGIYTLLLKGSFNAAEGLENKDILTLIKQ